MDLFLSHATRDEHAVTMVKAQVEALGVRLYLAEHDNKAGLPLSAKVGQALKNSEAVLVLLTKSGYDSVFVQQEIGMAKGLGKLVIPLLDPSLAGSDLGFLIDTEYIVFEPDNPSDGLARLSERVDGLARQHKADQDLAVALIGVAALVALLIYLDR